MIAKIHSAIPYGYTGKLIEVEGDTNRGLPGFHIVGMAHKTVFEARERVRSAITNSGLTFPSQKLTINLAPAELAKDGSHLDIPIALNILTLAGQLLPSDTSDRLFVGELSLDGRAKPVRGIINIVETAVHAGFKAIYVPQANLAQASLVPDAQVFGVTNLLDLVLHLKDNRPLPAPPQFVVKNTKTDTTGPFLDDVCGQTLVKRALTIAIAGRHNLLLSGSPGAGKTLLARVAANLLPPPSPQESISITKLHSLGASTDQIHAQRPFRAPHHTASPTALLGGGPHALPGEVSLAHHGVLFLDELPEFPRNLLEALRQPLEDKTITISRSEQRVLYPTDFMLIATMNPCPCGFFGDPVHPCTCPPHILERYRRKLSGPILDRIDLIINVEKVDLAHLTAASNTHLTNTSNTHLATVPSTRLTSLPSTPSADPAQPHHPHVKITQTDTTTPPEHLFAQKAILAAATRQHHRYADFTTYNSSLTPQALTSSLRITPAARAFLTTAAKQLDLSARAYFKVLKVAQTIADLDGLTEVDTEQISESLSFRQRIY